MSLVVGSLPAQVPIAPPPPAPSLLAGAAVLFPPWRQQIWPRRYPSKYSLFLYYIHHTSSPFGALARRHNNLAFLLTLIILFARQKKRKARSCCLYVFKGRVQRLRGHYQHRKLLLFKKMCERICRTGGTASRLNVPRLPSHACLAHIHAMAHPCTRQLNAKIHM